MICSADLEAARLGQKLALGVNLALRKEIAESNERCHADAPYSLGVSIDAAAPHLQDNGPPAIMRNMAIVRGRSCRRKWLNPRAGPGLTFCSHSAIERV